MTYSQRKTRKRKGTAAMLTAQRCADTLATNIEAEMLRGHCKATVSADEYAALVIEYKTQYRTPWERVQFWGDVLERVEATLLT